ncbi:MAG: hypothetical protein ISS79_09310 [Phycisphaerae bacterium]|nr:hypothetical protein [Phycisphaerae bacterium]
MVKAQKRKRKSGKGLWIPQSILKADGLNAGHKLLYAHIYSFGERGCWQTDEQLRIEFGLNNARTIQRWLSALKESGLLTIQCTQSRYRKIWASDNPAVKAAQKHHTESNLLRQKCPSSLTKVSELPRHNRPTTNTKTNTNTNTGGDGSPTPGKGQARSSPTKRERRQNSKSDKTVKAAVKHFGLARLENQQERIIKLQRQCKKMVSQKQTKERKPELVGAAG